MKSSVFLFSIFALVSLPARAHATTTPLPADINPALECVYQNNDTSTTADDILLQPTSTNAGGAQTSFDFVNLKTEYEVKTQILNGYLKTKIVSQCKAKKYYRLIVTDTEIHGTQFLDPSDNKKKYHVTGTLSFCCLARTHKYTTASSRIPIPK